MSITYDVFARQAHAEPLLYIGSVDVENGEEVRSACLKQYGPEDNWLEMVAVPQQQVIVVFSEQEATRS